MLSRDTGISAGVNKNNQNNDDNLFQKRGKSIENAIGTTVALPVGFIDSMREDQKSKEILNNADQSERDILKKYGYNNRDEYYDKLDALEAAGDTETYNNLVNTVGTEINNLYKNTHKEQEKRANDWADYRNNSYVGQKVNQDPGKFLGSAINTLSTAFDVMAPGAGILANSVQGGIEGIADELEQNGLENFDWGRAGENALTGATVGVVTGGLNKGISSQLAKNGGNLFKGGNALTRGLNDLGSKTAAGRIGSTLATGTARGAVSGAVGGATGAGLSAAMNGQDVLGSAIEGAKQGFGQGAMAGGIMAGAGLAKNKGMELVDNTRTNMINRNAVDRLVDGIENGANGDIKFVRISQDLIDDINSTRVAQGFEPLTDRQVKAYMNTVNNHLSQRVDEGMDAREVAQIAYNALTNQNATSSAMDLSKGESNIVFALDDKGRYNQAAIGRADSDGGTSLKTIIPNATDTQIKRILQTKEDILGSQAGVANPASLSDEPSARATISSRQTTGSVIPQVEQNVNGYDYVFEDARGNRARLPELRAELNPENPTVIANSELIDNPLRGRMYDRMSNNDFIDYAKQNGWKLIGTPEAEMVTTRIDAPETEVYRRLTGNSGGTPSGEEPFMAYGESDLGNRTRRGMIADSLERFGNTLEGAQTNVTRAAAKDLGIESTGKVVENVRKKTGITNLETQAKLARELTGGENSLMDNVQRNALSTREDGKPYRVDTTPIIDKVEDIVNKYADTNMFGSGDAKEKFINNLKKDISNDGTDVLGIANRMKSNAADLRGRGVASPTLSDSAKAKIYTEIANSLDDLSYKAIPQENVDAMFDATITEMRGRANQAAQNGNNDIARAYNRLANSLDAEPRTIKAFRSFKKNFVDTAKINDLTAQAENGAAAQMGRSFGGGVKRLLGTVAQRPVNAALAKAGGVVNRVADRVGGDRTIDAASMPDTDISNAVVDTTYNPATRVYEAIGRTEGLTNAEQARTANYLTDAVKDVNTGTQANPNSLESLAAPASTNSSTAVYNSMYGGGNTQNAGVQSTSNKIVGASGSSYFPVTGDYWADILAKAMTSAIDDNDVTAFASLYGMYQDALAKNSKNAEKDYSNPTNWNSSDRSKLLSAQNAMGQIDQLEQAYIDATGGGGGNVLQGNLRSLAANISGGNLDPSANNYNKLAESVGMGIVKNLINLGVTEADAKRYLEYLPSLTDTKEQVTQKLETLRNIYQNQINNLYSVYGA